MTQIENIYTQFLNYFPPQIQPIVSIILVILIIYSVWRIIQKDFIFIIALIVLVPGSIPIFQSVWQGLVAFLQFVFNYK